MKAITVFVHDKEDGYGLYGKEVKFYNGTPVHTDAHGNAKLLLPDEYTSVYVDGSEVWRGYASDIKGTILPVPW